MFSLPILSRTTLAFALACVAGFASRANASTHPPRSVPDLLRESDLVFSGTVVSIAHRSSVVVEDGDLVLPHTFVTFRIDERVKGASSAGDSITLRFLGGPDAKGRELVVAGVPTFRIGDQDLLFVAQNGERMCPLLGWENGRMRLVRGDVYDALGNELWLAPSGELVHGPAHLDLSLPSYPALATATVPSESAGDAQEIPAGALRADAAGMTAVLRYQLEVLRGLSDFQAPLPARSVNLGETFRFPALRVVPAPVLPAPKSAQTRSAEADSK